MGNDDEEEEPVDEAAIAVLRAGFADTAARGLHEQPLCGLKRPAAKRQ